MFEKKLKTFSAFDTLSDDVIAKRGALA